MKNILVFVPLLYSQNFSRLDMFLSAASCFFAFCMASSAIYMTNDIIDAEKDRLHPVKCRRPVASGQVGKGRAAIAASALFTAGLIIAIVGNGSLHVALFIVMYAMLNIAYSLVLKHIAIVDCFCIAAGFVLRVFAGGAAINQRISEWLFLTVTSASLFMAFGKRRGEMMQVSDGAAARKVLASYDLQFLNGMMFVSAGLSITFYALWAMLNVSTMIYTVPLVIFIVCRYLLIVHGGVSHGDPTTVILGDKVLMAAVCILGLVSAAFLYL